MAIPENVKTLIQEFVDRKSILAVEQFTATNSNDNDSVDLIARIFGFAGSFSNQNKDLKLISSFKNNLKLLIEKTWVEKSDIALKQQILFQLESFCNDIETWDSNYSNFLEIIANAVYLMFGQQAKSSDFGEYSLRIDPEFGIFWWYIQSLPIKVDWSSEKYRNAVLLGMYFLANY